MSKYAFVFSEEDCINCGACEVACRTWFDRDKDVFPRRLYEWFTGTYPNTVLRKLSVSCMHCDNPACVDVCPAGVLSRGEDGIVKADRILCIGCRACLDACPVGAPQYGKDDRIVKCTACSGEPGGPACVMACPSGALKFVEVTPEEKKEIDKATAAVFASIKK